MKTNIYCLASFAFIASFASFAFALDEEPYPGRLAPDFTLSDINGGQVNLSSLYAKGPVWMTIFTTWCDACQVEAPLLIEASRKYGAVQFIAVSLMENAEDARSFQKQYQIPYPVLIDEEGILADKYMIRPIPVNIGIMKEGKIAFRRQTIEEYDIARLVETLGPSEKTADSSSAADLPVSSGLGPLFSHLPFLASFLAGILTFLSPCVLPLIPAYLAFITGLELERLVDSENKSSQRKSLLVSTAFFVLGFAVVFTVLGATASALGRTVSSYQNWIRVAGGILMMVFGIHLTGLLSIIPLYRELRFKFEPKKTGLAAAFLMGIVFAVGWTPCVGPILAAILIYSASEATVGKGIVMLACYSAGIGTPFLMASGFLPQFQKFIKKIKPHLQEIEIGSGILIILLGVLLITNRLGFLTSLL